MSQALPDSFNRVHVECKFIVECNTTINDNASKTNITP